MQASLFDFGVPSFDPALPGLQRRALGDGAWVDYLPHWLTGHEALYRDLATVADWKQGRRLMYHRTVNVPRLTAAAPARGSSARLLGGMSLSLAGHYGVSFEGITLAWYRDGKDSVAPHGDRIGRLCDDVRESIEPSAARLAEGVDTTTQHPLFHIGQTHPYGVVRFHAPRARLEIETQLRCSSQHVSS